MSGIYILGGIAKGRRLGAVPSGVRPSPVRLRRALFEILGDIEDLHFFDLFAGTGAVGIEALSRGARDVVFVDKSRRACLAVQKNIRAAGLSGYGYEIVQEDAISWLDSHIVVGDEIIFAAPPYEKEIMEKSIASFQKLLSEVDGGIMAILQIHRRFMPDDFIIEPKRIHKVSEDLLLIWY